MQGAEYVIDAAAMILEPMDARSAFFQDVLSSDALRTHSMCRTQSCLVGVARRITAIKENKRVFISCALTADGLMRPVGFLLYEYDRETASVSIDVLCHEEWTDKKWKKNTAGGAALLKKLEAFYANTRNALITLYADSESVAFYLKQGFKLLNKNEFEMQKQM